MSPFHGQGRLHVLSGAGGARPILALGDARNQPCVLGIGAVLDLTDLEAICAVVDAGSLSAGASRVGCSQPALSRRIQRMERELGSQLLVRSGRGTAPTPSGEALLAFARETLDAYERLRVDLADGGAVLRGTLRIVASTTPGDYLVPELVGRFTDRHPHARVEVTVADSAAVPSALLDHRADIGFTGRKNPDMRLVHVPVAADEVVLAVRNDHALAMRAEVPLEALAGERVIWREDGSGTQRTFMEALAAVGAELPQGSSAVSLGSTQAVVSAVVAGLGIGVVSHRAVRHHGDTIRALRIAELPVRRKLWLVHRAVQGRSALLDAFVAFSMTSESTPGP